MLVVLMKQKNRCCDNRKARGLEKERAASGQRGWTDLPGSEMWGSG